MTRSEGDGLLIELIPHPTGEDAGFEENATGSEP